MLARLEAIDGVAVAEVDHRGELLRLASDGALEDAIQTLREQGYGADVLAETPAVERWYGRDTVRELSREEGEVIAKRVVTDLARSRGLAPSVALRLEDRVARALSSCFAARDVDAGTIPGPLRRECALAAEEAARDLVGLDGARELGGILLADLERAGSMDPQTG